MTYLPPFMKARSMRRDAVEQRKAQEQQASVAPEAKPLPANVEEAIAEMEKLAEPEVIEEAPEKVAEIAVDWNPSMLKAELLKIAQDAGLEVTNENTKVQIIEALNSL